MRREDHPVHDVPDGAVGALMTIAHDPEDEEEPFLVDIAVYQCDQDGWRRVEHGRL